MKNEEFTKNATKSTKSFFLFYPHTLTLSHRKPCLSGVQMVRDSVRGVRVKNWEKWEEWEDLEEWEN